MRWGIVLAAGLVACGSGAETPPTQPEVQVEVAPVRRDSIPVVLEAEARVESTPDGTALLVAPTDAVVLLVQVGPGEAVREGEGILRLDAPELTAAARALAAQATAATVDAERQRQLAADGIAARRQAEEREAGAAALRSQADAATALLGRTAVRSPLAGVVSRVLVRRGERVAAGALLAEVVDPARVQVRATVPVADLARLRPGQGGVLQLEGAPEALPVRVATLGVVVDPLANTAPVLLHPLAPDPSLRPGAPGRVQIRVGVHRGVLVVPASALVYLGNQPTVFTVGADRVARARAVLPGARDGGALEITGALEPGEQVVVTGAYGLVDSTRVRLPGDSTR